MCQWIFDMGITTVLGNQDLRLPRPEKWWNDRMERPQPPTVRGARRQGDVDRRPLGARAADLGGARVWSALAPADWIRRIPQLRLFDLGHGRRPSNPAFGARPLPTAGVAGHDYYLTPGSATPLMSAAGYML